MYNLHGIKKCLPLLVLFSALLSHGSTIAGTCRYQCKGEFFPIVSQNDSSSLHSLIDSPLTSTADTNDPTDTAGDNLSRRWGWIEFGAGFHTQPVQPLISFDEYDLRVVHQILDYFGLGGTVQYSYNLAIVDSPDLISDTGFIDPPHGRRFDIFAVGASRLNDYFMVGVGLGISHFSVAHRGDFTFSRESYLAPSALIYANVVFRPVTLGYTYVIAALPEDEFGSHSPPPDLHVIRFGLIFDFKKGG